MGPVAVQGAVPTSPSYGPRSVRVPSGRVRGCHNMLVEAALADAALLDFGLRDGADHDVVIGPPDRVELDPWSGSHCLGSTDFAANPHDRRSPSPLPAIRSRILPSRNESGRTATSPTWRACRRSRAAVVPGLTHDLDALIKAAEPYQSGASHACTPARRRRRDGLEGS